MTTAWLSWPWSSTFGTYARNAPDRAYDYGVPVADFLDQVVAGDFQPAYQAAIDAAYAHNIPRVIALPYATNINSTVYLDPPANLRSNPPTSISNPPGPFAWSMELIGQGSTNSTGNSSRLIATFDDSPALYVGPGIANKVEGIDVENVVSVAHPKIHSGNCVGIAISGGNGGAQRTNIIRCSSKGFYRGFSSGLNNGSLAERSWWRNCRAQDCYIGYDISSAQAKVCAVYDCYSNCTFHVVVAAQTWVIGGKFVTTGRPGISYVMSNVSTMNPTLPCSFTVDLNISAGDPNFANNILNVFIVQLPHFGNVALNKIGYNGSQTVTFELNNEQVQQYWTGSGGGPSINPVTSTDMQAEMQAATRVYACERATAFKGRIQVRNALIQCDSSVQLVDFTTTGDDFHAGLYNCVVDGNLSMDNFLEGTGDFAHSLAQSSLPVFDCSHCQAAMRDCDFGSPFDAATGGREPVLIRAGFWDYQNSRVLFDNCNLYSPNIHGGKWNDHDSMPAAWGFREFSSDWGMNGPHASSTDDNAAYLAQRLRQHSQRTPHGKVSALNSLVPVTETEIDAYLDQTNITDVWGNVIPRLVSHMPLMVSQPGDQKYLFAKYNGKFYTWGSDLNVTWNCKGGVPFIMITGGTDYYKLFPGLKINLDVDGGGTKEYLITEVYPRDGYIGIYNITQSVGKVPGSTTTVYSGSTFGQSPTTSVKKYGRQCEFAANIADLNGRTFNQDDIIWKIGATPGGSLGWVITTGGVMGAGADYRTFGTIAT